MINKPTLILFLVVLQLSAFAQQVYKLDLKKSKLFWKSPKTMANSKHFGYLLFNSGSLSYAATGEPTVGIFNLNMNSIRSLEHPTPAKNEKIEQQIKSADFFEVAKYPTANMVVKKITRTGSATTFNVTGHLTVKGITNAITFLAEIKKKGNTIEVSANFKIDRIKWNIHHIPNPNASDLFQLLKDKAIADEIPISLQLVFNP